MVRADVSISVISGLKGDCVLHGEQGLDAGVHRGSEKNSNRGDTRPDECVFKSPIYKQGKSRNKKGDTSREGLCDARKGWMEQRNVWNTGTDA